MITQKLRDVTIVDTTQMNSKTSRRSCQFPHHLILLKLKKVNQEVTVKLGGLLVAIKRMIVVLSLLNK